MLNGEPIVAIATGLDEGSSNPKTGAIGQVWILRSDMPPMAAKRRNLDDAICGDCKLRGHDGIDSGCYLAVWLGPTNVYKRFSAGGYHDVTMAEAQAFVEGRMLRLGAYGDPAAVPFDLWRMLLAPTASWISYTHAWKTCDERFKAIAMASVDSEAEWYEAQAEGWRTFRIRRPGERLIDGAEFVCPASDEAGHKVTCADCRLCRGTSSPARSVAIYVHGKPSSVKAFGLPATFFRRRDEAIA